MKDALNNILNFFYSENDVVSAYNNRLIFGIKESEYFKAIELLEEQQFIIAVGIRHSIPGYNLYKITDLGKQLVESGGFK
ncbi:MAG: hypothetical protein JST81_00445 [Bacteroidetes bacterium]|jgi:hypothetical protein|nr:hypothetical protein [Bacteroidota bacterium]